MSLAGTELSTLEIVLVQPTISRESFTPLAQLSYSGVARVPKSCMTPPFHKNACVESYGDPAWYVPNWEFEHPTTSPEAFKA
jgi:hypothetical protein